MKLQSAVVMDDLLKGSGWDDQGVGRGCWLFDFRMSRRGSFVSDLNLLMGLKFKDQV